MSVPRARSTSPAATATAEPELDPPGIRPGQWALGAMPCGDRTPTRPVANWSMFVLPTTTAPASTRRWTAGADDVGVNA